VLVVPVGSWEVRKMIEAGLKQDAIKYIRQLLCTIMKEMREQHARQFVVILDSAELTFWKVAHLESKSITYESAKIFLMSQIH